MLKQTHPKLPMRNKAITREFYCNQLGFEVFGADFEGYLMVQKDQIQLHFFEFLNLNPLENYGQVYIRTQGIEGVYNELLKKQSSHSSRRIFRNQILGSKRILHTRP
jgi:hypothetical protein